MTDIDEIRRANLRRIEAELGGPSAAAKAVDMSPAQFANLRDGAKDSKTGKRRGMRKETARSIEARVGKPVGWLDTFSLDQDPSLESASPPRDSVDSDIVIAQYNTGGSMGHGFSLEDNPPGLIKSWRVEREWLRLNAPVYTSTDNLCIVTGFGPSMKPRYNPGDPLLCDLGVQEVEVDGIYFFRIDGHGFIKQLQRIPTEAGVIIRAKSFNADYDSFEISPKMDFQVIGKILMVWRSEQF